MIVNKDLLSDNAGPSSDPPPPPFTDIDHSSHLPPPPQFAPYEADFFTIDNDNIVSHDPHLNTDAYQVKLSTAFFFPSLSKRPTTNSIVVAHTESRPRVVTQTNSGGSTTQNTQYDRVTVTDFDFYIDIHPSLPTSSTPRSDSCGPVHWSVLDSDPAYRGRMVKEMELPLGGGKRKATWSECRQYDKWRSERVTQGLPPWVSSDNASQFRNNVDSTVTLTSSKSLRQWADEYCASPNHLKEFVYEKVLYGWNIKQLEEAVRTIISMASYHESIQVSFNIKNSKVYVRPHNKLSRMLSITWLKFLCCIFLIYPFIWLYRRFHSGGRWKVCGGAYSFKREVTEGLETIGRERKVYGVREGEWFRQWENVIKRSVLHRYVSSTPITLSGDENNHRSPVGYLDGY